MLKCIFLVSFLASAFFARAQNVGIGTTTPAAKLDVIGSIKITDGTQGANKILTSSSTGLATWTTAPASPCFSFASAGAVTNNDYIGLGTSSANFLRSTIVVPSNCELTSIVLSTRGQSNQSMTATVFRQIQNGVPVAAPLSVTVPVGFSNYAVANGSVLLQQGDLISVQVSTSSSNGVAISVTYR